MSLTLIKPGTKIDFMGKRKICLMISALVIVAGIVMLAVFGLNLGIDFKGGTKMVLAFKGTDPIDRDMIRDAVATKFAELHPGEDLPQVEVQDFYAGGTEEDVVRYMVYTEMVTLLTEKQKGAILEALHARFGEDTVANPPTEGGDQFFITFANEAPIEERARELEDIFKAQGMARVVVESDKVRDLSMEFFKEVNLERAEASSPERLLEELEAEDAFRQRVLNFKKANTDISFTVKIEEIKVKMEDAIKGVGNLGERFLAVETATSISPSVGSDMLNTGLLAVIYACIGILLYIALRFDFKYGPGAVAALLHDAFIVIAVFAFAQIPFSLPIVAAVLTIIGYSVNDTIVVFDRIRENFDKLKGMPFKSIINQSINETLSRTLLTSLTTLAVVISIFVLGGGLIQDFAFALIVGILVGTYSSIFIASPILLGIDRLTAARK